MSAELAKRLRSYVNSQQRMNDGHRLMIEAADTLDRHSPTADLLKAAKGLLAASEKHIFGDECKIERDAMRAAIRSAEGGEETP